MQIYLKTYNCWIKLLMYDGGILIPYNFICSTFRGNSSSDWVTQNIWDLWFMALHRYFNKSKGTFVFTLRWNPNTTVIVIKIFREPLWEECWKGPRKKTTFIIETVDFKVFTTNKVSQVVFYNYFGKSHTSDSPWCYHCRNLKIKCMINTAFPNFPKHW